jgi:hypothetical protein
MSGGCLWIGEGKWEERKMERIPIYSVVIGIKFRPEIKIVSSVGARVPEKTRY